MRLNKQLLFILATVFSCSFLLLSCRKPKPETPDFIAATPTSVTLAASNSSTASISIECNGDWYVASKPDWINVSSTSGSGNTSVTLTALSDNESTSPRSAELELKSGSASTSILITQSGKEPETIEVNPTSISLVSSANSTAYISIICDGMWSISAKPDWINVSSTSGKGNTSLTITALSANESSKSRIGYLEVRSGSAAASLEIAQVAGLESGCEIEIIDEVLLTTSVTFSLQFGSQASYFYAGYFPITSAGWSDAKIIAELENNGTPMTAESDIYLGADGLIESTTYVQCMVAYNEKGKRGELIRRTFATPSSKDAPVAYISNVAYDDNYWYYTTTIGGTAREYYILTYTGIDALTLFLSYSPAEIGMLFKKKLNNLTSYVNTQSWKSSRTADETDLEVCTWAKRDEKWSPVLTTYYGHIDTEGTRIISNSPAKKSTGNKCKVSYPADREKISKQIKVEKIN